MKRSLVLISACCALTAFAVPPEVTNVRASQRADSKLVDIYYDVSDVDSPLLKIRVEISDNDGVKYSIPAFTLTGDVGGSVVPGAGKHIVWDAGADWDGEYSDQMRVKVFAVDGQGYPGMEWGDEIPPGGFLLGQDGGAEGSGPSRHVNIPYSYWLSKYEISNQQYCDFLNTAYAAGLVQLDGTSAVYTKTATTLVQCIGASRELLEIGDDKDIRWNVNNFEVVGHYTNFPVRTTWYGAMAFAHFYGYDLPTVAEWEKAARGPDFDDQDEHKRFPWGDSITGSCANYYSSGDPYSSHFTTPCGYYNGNQIPVGEDMKNGYGLYDVCGNVSEWTLTSSSATVNGYPQTESLTNQINQYWMFSDFKRKGGDAQAHSDAMDIYLSSSTDGSFYPSYYTNGSSIGFRVCRRYKHSRPKTEIMSTDIETWPVKGRDSGSVSIPQGTALFWKVGRSIEIRDDPDNAFSGSQYLYESSSISGPAYSLVIPSFSNQLVEVRAMVRNPSSGSNQIVLHSGDSVNGFTCSKVSIPGYSDYRKISLQPTQNATTYYLDFYDLYVDDIEILTIPRTIDESED